MEKSKFIIGLLFAIFGIFAVDCNKRVLAQEVPGTQTVQQTQSIADLWNGFYTGMTEEEALSHARNTLGSINEISRSEEHKNDRLDWDFFGRRVNSRYFEYNFGELKIPEEFKTFYISFSTSTDNFKDISLFFLQGNLWAVSVKGVSKDMLNALTLRYGKTSGVSPYTWETATKLVVLHRSFNTIDLGYLNMILSRIDQHDYERASKIPL
jgi:hypothetical protein